jgi:pimeloyl-ACP methyl ester carboxylesterase
MRTLVIALTFVASVASVSAQKPFNIQRQGNGKPILFLPGFTTPGSVWNQTIQNLDGNYESYTVTYAGFDGLPPIETPWYDQIRDGLIHYIQKENLQNLVVVGHSMGGNLAVDLAAALPKQITGLILIESIPCMRELMMPGVPAESLQYDSPYNNQVLQMNADAFRQMANGLSQNMTFDSSRIQLLSSWTIQADRKTYVYGYTDLLKLDLRDKLKSITVKTLILGASFPDKAMVLSNYEKQYANLAAKEILIADNCKHFIMFDQPAWLETNIQRYLQANANN